MKQALFLDSSMEKDFQDNGFILIPEFLKEKQLAEVRSFYNETHLSVQQTSMWNTIFSEDKNLKTETTKVLREICSPVIQQYFSSDTQGNGYFMVKNPSKDSQSKPHQDPSIIDFNRYNSGTIWIPLVDINEENGIMYLLKGSHVFGNIPVAYFQQQEIEDLLELLRPYLTFIKMKAGDALFFHHKVIHGSLPNLSRDSRPAIAYSVIPKDAQLYFPYLNKGWWRDKVEFYNVDMDFFITNPINIKPVGKKLSNAISVTKSDSFMKKLLLFLKEY